MGAKTLSLKWAVVVRTVRTRARARWRQYARAAVPLGLLPRAALPRARCSRVPRVQIAIIFEFTGALVLGRVSQETISGGIADIGAFTTDPEFCAFPQRQLPASTLF